MPKGFYKVHSPPKEGILADAGPASLTLLMRKLLSGQDPMVQGVCHLAPRNSERCSSLSWCCLGEGFGPGIFRHFTRNVTEARQWWRTPLIPALGSQGQMALCVTEIYCS